MSAPRPLIAAGLGLWLLSGLEVVAEIVREGDYTVTATFIGLVVAYLGFGAGYAVTFLRSSRLGRGALVGSLALQTAFALLYLDLTVVLLLAVPLVVDRALAVRYGIAVLALTALRLASSLALEPTSTALGVGAEVVRIALIQLVALVAGLAVADERATRRALGEANVELEATRHELAIAARDAERARIGLELHDGLGHHLVALGLQLELARRHLVREGSTQAEALAGSRSLVSSMLDDVRAIVRAQGPAERIPLRETLEAMAEALAGVHVELTLEPEALDVRADVASVIVRVAQEATSNAVRHGHARTIRVGLARVPPEGVALVVEDDGTGELGGDEGSGMRGMRARAAALGGEVTWDAVRGRGTLVRMVLP